MFHLKSDILGVKISLNKVGVMFFKLIEIHSMSVFSTASHPRPLWLNCISSYLTKSLKPFCCYFSSFYDQMVRAEIA